MPNLIPYDSLDLFDNIVRNVFRPMAYETMRSLHANDHERRQEVRLIRMDVAESEQGFRIAAELPGIKKDDISVTIEGNRLMISAESKREKIAEDITERVLSGERFYGKLRRTIQLPEDIDDSAAIAKYRDGVLDLFLPKKKAKGSKRLEIQ